MTATARAAAMNSDFMVLSLQAFAQALLTHA
jgi:hypothetical protein